MSANFSTMAFRGPLPGLAARFGEVLGEVDQQLQAADLVVAGEDHFRGQASYPASLTMRPDQPRGILVRRGRGDHRARG
jgi:hypothetical protein